MLFQQRMITMKLDLNIGIGQKQGLNLTAQVQQAIKLLQMTNLELTEYIEENFVPNPFVELKDTTSSKKVEAAEPKATESKSTVDSIQDTPFAAETSKTKTEVENQFETGDSYSPKSTVSKEQSDFDPIQLLKSQDKSLYVHCSDFVTQLDLNPQEQLIAFRFIEELEPTGWIDVDMAEIAHIFDADLEMVEGVLELMQNIEPAGLFARSLAECLTLQAIDRGLLTETLASIFDNLHLLGSGKFDLLKRRCGCDEEVLAENLKSIKSLDPKPGLQLASHQVSIREPDLNVKNQDDGWIVELNRSTLPSVFVDKDYARDVQKRTSDPEQKEFIREKIAEANWLSNALKKRNDTMLKVGTEIVKRQRQFLEKGPSYIQPMVLRDIAEAVEMHESTISRVTTGSLMETPQGTLELKSFFSVSLQLNDDNSSQSAASVKFKILRMVEGENPHKPVSDDEIVDNLKQEGINIARRTVAKYRKLQKIPASFMRKRQSTLAGMV
jgi:RNA polymerase sigma-54 factor